MFFADSREPLFTHSLPSETCSHGHTTTSILPTQHGGAICLLCLSSLLASSSTPTIHVSFALSQLSIALSEPQFLQTLITFHVHLLVSPLIYALASFNDESIARQITDVVVNLCSNGGQELVCDFSARISEQIASGALAWSQRQVYMLHCFGVLINCEIFVPNSCIKDKHSLVANLVEGLQMPSEEIQGEVLFILHRLSIYQYYEDDDLADVLAAFCPKLLHLSLEALMKSEMDDVRLNCVAFLTVLAKRGILQTASANGANPYEGDNFLQATEDEGVGPDTILLLAEAVKGPLLSSDKQVQIDTLNLIFHYLSWEGTQRKQLQVLIEENIADYVFEALRLSGCKDPVVSSCMQVLDLLSSAEQAFRRRLAIGFTALVPVLCYVAEFPFHPVQCQTLNLLLKCVSSFPGIASTSQVADIVLALTRMLKMQSPGELGVLPETFMVACLVFVAIIRTPFCSGISDIPNSIQEASKYAILTCLNVYKRSSCLLLHALHLLKEAYTYSCQEHLKTSYSIVELRSSIVDTCMKDLLPWFLTAINEIEDEQIVFGFLETFHSLLVLDCDTEGIKFAEILVSSSWFSFSFGCLGLFPTENMKGIVYLMLSSLVDLLLGGNSGQPIRDAASYLPTDPNDLFLLTGQKASNNSELAYCQSAILLILYVSSYFDDRLADEKLVLASLEQYILVNCSGILCGSPFSSTMVQLVSVYGLFRALSKTSYQIAYSGEAEKILFQLMTSHDWDLFSARIHSASLKWFFQQEKLNKFLSHQILKFCRNVSSIEAHMIVHEENNQFLDEKAVGALVATGDNYGARILVCLLEELLEEEGQDHDIFLVINFMSTIIKNFPAASDELCLHGVSNAIRTLYNFSSYSFSTEISMAVLLLLCNILRSANPETLPDDNAWLLVTLKLMDYLIPSSGADMWTHESLLLVGVLSLILHHASVELLLESSKCILLHTSLISAINCTIHAACAKGPALVDFDEDTSGGMTLVFILLLYYFSLKSLNTVLPGTVDWQAFLEPSKTVKPISIISIHCNDLCRLLYFGSPLIKLVSSYCLREVFIRVSEQIIRDQEFKCTTKFLPSIVSVLEGLVFDDDNRVALNACLCLSVILGWEKMDMQKLSLIQKNAWCRLIVEELVVSLATPSLASKSFSGHHSSAVYVAVALFKPGKIPEWMRSVIDSSVPGIIKNLTANNMSTEMVLLFRELLNSGFLNAEHISSINRVLQVCRKCLYADNTSGESSDNHTKKVTVEDDLGELCGHIIQLMSTEASPDINKQEVKNVNTKLLEEIEMFFRTLAVEDDQSSQ